jgi:hypothetical protein
MKRSAISAAVVATLGVAGSAHALGPAGPHAYQIHISGASASNLLVQNLVIDHVCDAGSSIDLFKATGGGLSSAWAVSCKIDAAATGAAANNVVIRKRNAGGSGMGVSPVATAATIDFMEISTSNCGSSATSSFVSAGGRAVDEWTCNLATESLVPDAGFSDIEPKAFVGVNTPAGFTDFAGGPLDIHPVGGLVFGVPVNTALRDALQAVQGLTVGAEDEANMPSLSAQVVRSIMTGGVKTWNDIKVDDGGSLVGLASHSAVTPPADVKKMVHICRRVNGSGTQAQMNAIFMNYPCDTAVKKPATAPGSITTGPFVAENSGSSDVGRCLDDFNDASNASGKNVATGPFLPANRTAWAIGVQSTEKNSGLTRNYRFIKVDGVAPTLQNVHAGKYFDFAEQSMQWRNDGSKGTAYGAFDSEITTVLTYIKDNAVSAAALAPANNASFTHPWGNGGWLSVPGVETPDLVFDTANPVNSITRAPFGQAPNTCQLPVSTTGLLRAD